MTNSRTSILMLWLIGVLAAAQLAKMAILAPTLAGRFGLSVAMTGLLISLLEIGGALFGLAAGLALGRVGARRSLMVGIMALAITGLAEAYAPGAVALLAARAVEGLGYLMVVIAVPTLIAALASERDLAPSLALWSTFVSVGMGVGSAVTGLALWTLGLRGALEAWPVLCALGLVAAAHLPPGGPPPARVLALPNAASWIATFGFGIYTCFICALTMLYPTFLVERAGASATVAGVVTGVVAMGSVPGAAIAMALARLGRLSRRRTVAAIASTLAAAAAAAPWALSDGAAPDAVLWTSAGSALWISFFSGIASPIVFGRLPMIAGARSPTDPRIAAANGLLTQFGAGGALLGPPVGGLAVMHWGWGGLGLLIGALALATLCALVTAEFVASRVAAPGRTMRSADTGTAFARAE